MTQTRKHPFEPDPHTPARCQHTPHLSFTCWRLADDPIHAPEAEAQPGVRIDRSKEWWMEKARSEGDATIGAGLPPAPPADSGERRIERYIICTGCGLDWTKHPKLLDNRPKDPAYPARECGQWKFSATSKELIALAAAFAAPPPAETDRIERDAADLIPNRTRAQWRDLYFESHKDDRGGIFIDLLDAWERKGK